MQKGAQAARTAARGASTGKQKGSGSSEGKGRHTQGDHAGPFFGVIFGFLLQKGGVGKYEVLLGALFLTDFTVMKSCSPPSRPGMIGIFSLHALGLVELHVKPTRYAANIIGDSSLGLALACWATARARELPRWGRGILMPSQAFWAFWLAVISMPKRPAFWKRLF